MILYRQAELFEIVLTAIAAGGFGAAWTAGKSDATKTPIIAITTSRSTSLKPPYFPHPTRPPRVQTHNLILRFAITNGPT